MKYEKMIDCLKSERRDIQEKFADELYGHVYYGILDFGAVYVYPATYHQGVRGKKTEDLYGIDINEKLWLFIETLLRTDFNIIDLGGNAFKITLK